ncbi:MAG: hypothetical protein M1281_14340, partial [Chloroflexi bacterium]|nr:hypothetical protein [Chloroflexota bacterium]
ALASAGASRCSACFSLRWNKLKLVLHFLDNLQLFYNGATLPLPEQVMIMFSSQGKHSSLNRNHKKAAHIGG